MPKTTTSCPRCKQPVLADVEPLFDLQADPAAKQRLLSGSTNTVLCQNCGYQGMLATPIVYHDPDKELLLTFFPPELGLPVNEQERMIGPYLNQVMNRLPPEKRKAYLLRPLTMLTYDAMIERILEADGITKEIIQAQQKRLNLLTRLMSATSEDARKEIIKQEVALVDADFFGILSRLVEAAIAQGDKRSAQQLAVVQKDLLTETEFGRNLAIQAQEAEAAVQSLQEAGKDGLTREKLLDLLIQSPSETRLSALVGMARSGMDYEFFQILSSRIDQADGDDKEKLISLREKLLDMTAEIDRTIQEQLQSSLDLLDSIVNSPDIEKALEENVQAVNEFFTEVLRTELDKAQKNADKPRVEKLEVLVHALQKYMAPPPEIQFIQELLAAEDEEGRLKILETNQEKVTPELVQIMGSIANQPESGAQSQEGMEKVRSAYRTLLRYSMKANLTRAEGKAD